MKSNKDVKTTEARWTKAQIIASSKFIHNKDVLNAVLDADTKYTVKEVETMISKYMKGGVK